MTLNENHFDGGRNTTSGTRDAAEPILAETLNEKSDTVTVAAALAAGLALKQDSLFVSAEQTGTGNEEDVTHGLVDADGAAVVPTHVLIVPSYVPAGENWAPAQGAHDDADVKINVTVDQKFFVVALP